MSPTAAPDTLGTDAVELLRNLIRINTVNPPGNEGPAQEMLSDLNDRRPIIEVQANEPICVIFGGGR